jgi:hypothetical protein
MKLILILSLLLLTNAISSAQSAPCNNQKIITPTVTKPADASLVSTTCSTMVVKWHGPSNRTYVVQGIFKDAVTNHTDTLQATNIVCDNSASCTATIAVIPGKQVMWSVEAQEISNGVTYTSYALRSSLDYPIASCRTTNPLEFTGKVFLQGAYNTTTGNMNNTLNSLGILQTYAATQPYKTAPFNYPGTEVVGAGFFATHPYIVDWVLLELRNANLPANPIARKAAFVKQDGTLVDIDGTNSQITFPGIAAGYYYVTILHRNHLGIRTAAALDFSSGSASHDFTIEPNNLFKNQNYLSSVKMGNAWVMRGGYTNTNPTVKYSGPGNDQNQILNNKLGGSIALVLDNVYAREDVNMNGNIKWSGPDNDQNFILNISLGGSISAIFTEQL